MTLALCAAFVPPSAAAPPLAPSQVTRDTYSPQPASPPAAFDLPPAALLAAPLGAQGLRLRVRHIIVEQGFADLREATLALAKPLEGRKVSVAQLFALANAVEALYGANGYALVRVTVPPQRLADGGDARIRVIDGFIESLSLADVPERSRAVVFARLAPLVGRRRLKSAELERAVLLAGDVVGLRLASALARGATLGGVALGLKAQERLVTGALGTDNNLPASLGGWEWNARLALNNPLGFGEQGYLSVTSGYALGGDGFAMSPLRTLAAGVVSPVGVDGLTLNPEVTQSLTHPLPAAGAPPSTGALERAALRASFPLQRTRASNLTLTAALELTDQQLYSPLQNVDFSHDRYTALRVGASWQGATFWGASIQTGAQASQGLGGRRASDAVPLSRLGAGPDFTKLTGDVKLSQPLPGALRLDLSAHGQWTFQTPQLTSEEFALDGADALSAFPQGAFSVDAGETARAELSRPVVLPTSFGAMSLSPYLFGAQGYGLIYKATVVEQSRLRTAAFGLGARFNFDRPDGFSGGFVAFELSRGLSDVPGATANNRAAISAGLQF